jgi:hypothetical protein
MSLPIIFIHLGNSNYLLYTLYQAKKTNSESNVILIGDNSNQNYNFVEHKNMHDYTKDALNFSKIYKHYSVNPLEYELFCFQRWFILKNFMLASNIEKCLYIDSDIMLYANVTEEQKKFSNFDLTLSLSTSPHCCFINNLNVLKDFCNFMVYIYTEPSEFNQMESNFERGIKTHSDMTIFWEFGKRKYAAIGEMSTIIDDSKFDHNINCSEQFEMCNEMKNIYFLGEEPFCKSLSSGQQVKFNSIHFQGAAKKHIQNYFRGEIIIVGETYVILPFKLGEINLIIFPNWSVLEDSLALDLEKIMRTLASHPDKNHITLLIESSGISDEDANLVLSSVTMNLLMQEDGDVSDMPEIYLVEKLEEIQWKVLLPRIQSRIVFGNENLEMISKVNGENIPCYSLDSFSEKRGIKLDSGAWTIE